MSVNIQFSPNQIDLGLYIPLRFLWALPVLLVARFINVKKTKVGIEGGFLFRGL